MNIKKWYYKIIRKSPASMEMVQYWRYKESVSAKVTKSKDGSLIMKLDGEKYPLATYPRGYLLFGKMSKLKHEIKNQIFNDSWRDLENGVSEEEVIKNIKQKLFGSIAELAEQSRYDMLPSKMMCPSVREIHRAWTKVSPETSVLRDYLCFILQEDDSYRFRMSDMMEYFNPNIWWKRVMRFVMRESYEKSIERYFSIALGILENCEIISDMKERQRLFKRVLILILKDENIMKKFNLFCQELDWKKVFMTKGDRFHFRGKYYKADYRLFDY